MAIPPGEWLDLAEHEYLRRFVPGSGSSVKFLIADDAELITAESGLRRLAAEQSMVFAHIDAAGTRIHMIQDVFFAVARKVDWTGLAQRWLESMVRENRYTWPRPGKPVPLRELAETNDVAEALLSRDVKDWLTRFIFRNHKMAQDFRSAMAHLCLGRLEPDDPVQAPPVIDWLVGDLRLISAVRDVPIGARITRHNARAMMRSLCHWLGLAGVPGLVVTLDLRQIASRTPRVADGIRYTPAATLDALEVLRQLIDDCDLFEGLFFVVLGNETLIEGEPRRTITAYPALRARLVSDVMSRQHDNPLAPLVRLGGAGTGLGTTGGEMTYSTERVAIEALRAGVPNRAATRLLGSDEARLTEQFVERLKLVRADTAGERTTAGELIEGGFGSGKSHVLGYLAEHALQQNFVVSSVAISKETPLFHPERLYAAAIRNAVIPDVNDDAMAVVVERLISRPEELQRLEAWASSPQSGLTPMFAALLHILPKQFLTQADRAAVARFFAGSRLGTVGIRQWLRAAGVLKLFSLARVRIADLALQRLRFAPRLFKAAGFSGWCLMIDELELIAAYSTLQRGKSYAELARWLALDGSVGVPGLVTIGAMTNDFQREVFDQRLDQEKVPGVLEGKGLAAEARLAEIAMRLIERSQHPLRAPDERRLATSLEKVSTFYSASYGWTPRMTSIGERRADKTMRAYIKSWITGWDIERLYGTRDDIETEAFLPDYSENPDLEKPATNDEDEP